MVLARRIEELAGTHPRFGYRRIWAIVDPRGLVGQQEGGAADLAALGAETGQTACRNPEAAPAARAGRQRLPPPPLAWAKTTFGHETLSSIVTSDGRSLKWLSLIDEYTRECLALEARRGMTAEEIPCHPGRGRRPERGGPPHRVRGDNGPEFAAEVVRGWLEGTGSGALYVAPASPWQNGYAESFHSKLRDEFLEREEFESEPQARALGTLWKEEYNTERPHSSLGYKTPAEFAATCARYVPIEAELKAPMDTEQENP